MKVALRFAKLKSAYCVVDAPNLTSAKKLYEEYRDDIIPVDYRAPMISFEQYDKDNFYHVSVNELKGDLCNTRKTYTIFQWDGDKGVEAGEITVTLKEIEPTLRKHYNCKGFFQVLGGHKYFVHKKNNKLIPLCYIEEKRKKKVESLPEPNNE
jgi:hypothetical protein